MKTFAVLCVIVAAAIAGPVNKFDWKNVMERSEPNVLQSGHGSMKPGIESRITGGMLALPHQFPYQVGLYMQIIINENGDSEFAWCGASLISSRVVLTAAHCLYGVADAVVLLGAHSIPDKNDGKVMVRVDARDFIIHEQYDPITVFNDIGLIILPEAAPLSKIIQTVDLPNSSEDESYLEGKLALITGWGKTGDNGDLSMDLRYAYLRILPANYCQMTYPVFHPTQICVSGANRKSVCSGDSGGPLVVPGPSGKNTVVGLTSFGRREGCQKGYPVAFTRVTSYLDWIANNSGVQPKNY